MADAPTDIFETLEMPGWPRPRGYAHGIAARGRTVFVAGMIGWDAEGRFPPDLAGQVRQALQNIVDTLAEAGGRPEHLARLTWFVTSKPEYLAAQAQIGQAYRAVLGRHYPAMSVVEVSALLEDQAKVEIEATAVVPG